MADNYADRGFTINDYNKSGNAFQNLLAQQERRKERDYAIEERNRDQKEQQSRQNRLYNLREIDGDTDLAKYQTGEQAFDNYSAGQLKAIKENAIQNYINLDPAEMEYKLSKDMGEFAKWHGSVKGQIKQADARLQEFNKEFANTNAVASHNIVHSKIVEDFLEVDPQTGDIKRKPLEFVKPRDYVADLYNPKVLAGITNDVSPFSQYFQNQKVSPVGEKDYKSRQGVVKAYKWSGAETAHTQRVTDSEGKVVGMDMKYQPFDLGGGKVLKLATDDVYNEMMHTPKLLAATSAMWEQEKQRRNIQPKNETEDNILLRNFIYEKGKTLLPHGFKAEEIEKTPPIRISVNGGGGRGGGSRSGDPQISDVYQEVDDLTSSKKEGFGAPLNELSGTAQVAILEYARKITGRTNLSQSRVFVRKEPDGMISIVDKNSGEVIAPLDYKDLNLKANSSLGVKAKQKIVNTDNSNPSPKPKATSKKATVDANSLRQKYNY